MPVKRPRGRKGDRPEGESEPKDPLVVKSGSIGDVFRRLVTDVDSVIEATGNKAAVDIEVTFTAMTLDQSGIPLFSKKKSESTMQLKLATRVMPE